MFKDRAEILRNYPSITEGMEVYSSNGDKLGKVVELGNEYFTVEKGFFFPKDFTIRYDEIQDVRDGSLYLNLAVSDLSEWRNESYEGWQRADDYNTGRVTPQVRDEFRDRYKDRDLSWGKSSEEVRVPVVEEELEAKKVARETGGVQIKKVVHTELKHFTVPVQKEELRVERVPVTSRESVAGAASNIANIAKDAFQEKTINIPVVEEEVTISKRPVVKEEIRVSKERTTEERKVEGEVRREEVRIEGEDQLRKKKVG